jgi:hypothetical protein
VNSPFRLALSALLLSAMMAAPAAQAQSGNFSSITAISTPNPLVPVPIFSISRTNNVITLSTSDPTNPDQFAQQSNQAGTLVTIAQVTADPSNAANGTFLICGPPTAGCVVPTTSFSYLSTGKDFSVASATQVGLSAVARTPCPLLPTGFFSFCGDSRPGAGIAYPTDGSLLEVIATEDSVGTMLWASSLGDGNSGSTRVTGCEQMFIESGNEWRLECDYLRRYGGAIDVDMKNNLLVLSVGDGSTTRGTGGEFAMSGVRKLATLGILQNRTITFDTGANPSGTVMPATGIVRLRNGSTVCWENVAATNALCQGTDAGDHFSFDGGVSAPNYHTATRCADPGGQCAGAAAGSVVMQPGSTSVVVYTTAVNNESQIFVQEDSSMGSLLGVTCNSTIGRSYQVTQRLAGVGFRIATATAPQQTSACLSYHIVN